jgi:radical SAM superfamily enzyme YgiQ (UPF0313 family)
MNILMIFPRWPEGTLWGDATFKFPVLSLTTLAALTPPQHNIKLVDENVQEIDFDYPADLVCISSLTPLINRAYAIADRFREIGVKVIIGGVHVTWMPEEASEHVDAVVLGEADEIWPGVVEDVEKGTLKKRYRADRCKTFSGIPPARRDLFPERAYRIMNTVQTTRGCPHDCEFCAVTAFFGRTYRCRPVEEVVEDLKSLKGRFVLFADDNLIAKRSYTLELLKEIKKLGLCWASASTINIAKDEEVLRLCAESGCMGIFIGIESLVAENLLDMGKSFVDLENYRSFISKIRSYGIGVLGSFVVGYDHDTEDVFDTILEFAEDVRLEALLVSALTPFPGTKAMERLERQGRILTKDWSKYDMNTVVIKPERMSPERLQEGINSIYTRFYSFRSMFRRLSVKRPLALFLPINLGLRESWRKMTST